jgi:hypothetical protein
MELIFLIGGFILGTITSLIFRARERIHGIVHVDHETEQCAFTITSDQLSNKKKKIAVFVINHNAQLSREEQGL